MVAMKLCKMQLIAYRLRGRLHPSTSMMISPLLARDRASAGAGVIVHLCANGHMSVAEGLEEAAPQK